jgi:hypothetical protein
MSLPDFKKMMTHDVILRKLKSNSAGDYSNLSSSSLKGFVEYGNKLFKNKKGEELTCRAIVFLMDDCGIDINWPDWAIDQIVPYNRPNLSVELIDPIDNPINKGQTHHFEIYCI